MAIILATPVGGHAQQAPWNLNFSNIFKSVQKKGNPIDGRDLQEYLSKRYVDEARTVALLTWLDGMNANVDFEEFCKEFEAANPDLDKLLKANHGITSAGMKDFFAESLLLFFVLKNGYSALYENQFGHWLQAWISLDFRQLSGDDVQIWGKALLNLYALAMDISGPFSLEEETRMNTFFKAHPELGQEGWSINIRRVLSGNDDRYTSNKDNVLGKRQDVRIGPSILGGMSISTVAFVVGAIAFMPQLHVGSPLGSLFLLLGFLGAGGAAVIGGGIALAYGVNVYPVFYPGVKRSSSYMLTDVDFTCESILERRKAKP